ncbi:MAG: serine kinase [Bacteroidales bacterium]|nr:serine kinase [Bacteroidales bacterium]MCF8454437.1 serine kinase [Bacteroidales bacterium]
MKLQEIINKFELKALTHVEDREITGVYISDMLSDVMSSAQAGNLWLTIQTHKNIVSAANLIDISAVIVTNGKQVLGDTIELANRFHVVILTSPLSNFELATKFIQAGIK